MPQPPYRNLWRQKVAAFLHDPPHKQFDISHHDAARGVVLRHLGLSEEEMRAWWKSPDWWASAADRYPFPKASQLYVDWSRDGKHEFHHPLAGTRFVPKAPPRVDSHVGEQWLEDTLHGIVFDGADDRARLFRLWRFWAVQAAREKNELLAYLPADSRIPDHTIWQHNTLCSALEGTQERPAFLLMQIGPVQEFIAQSRQMQDLWAGSYLLSFLISKALAVIALELGPDAIIYPSLRGVPLLDWWWSREKGLFPDDTFKMGQGRLHPDELLTPSLPNRFLALVPAGEEGQRIAQMAETALCEEWRRMADAVHEDLCSKLAEHLRAGAFPDWDNVWEAQVLRFPVIDWTLHEWSEKAAEQAAQGTPPLTGGWEKHPLRHADLVRDILGESKHSKTNLGSHWALHYAATDWKFAATKNARAFAAWSGTLPSAKDHLNGRDEILGGANADAFWEALRAAYQGEARGDFKGRQRYGAMTVIKRLWSKCYLGGKLGWPHYRPRFESVPDIAEAIDDDTDESSIYYAVLCLDGDDLGQWVSGHKAPPLAGQLADKAGKYFHQTWKQEGGLPPSDQVQRPLSPSYHAALSEALNHFSLYAAGQVVKAFDGQLFYAGGDDVLAILPAPRALDCAMALRCAFQGRIAKNTPSHIEDKLNQLFDFPVEQGGFLTCQENAGRAERLRPNWPLLVPGPTATVSVGIAIGHVRQPMQDIIQAAREAESVAKKVRNKGAFCLRVLKRSGENAEFAARFESRVSAVWAELEANVHDLSGRFAYRYLSLLKPLLACSDHGHDAGWIPEWTDELVAICRAELTHVLKQQGQQTPDKAEANAGRWIGCLIGRAESPALRPKDFLHFWMAWAFVHRTRPESSHP